MKVILILIISLSGIFNSSNAQGDRSLLGNYFTFIQPEKLSRCNLLGDETGGSETMTIGLQFIVTRVSAEFYVIQILKTKGDDVFNQKYLGQPDEKKIDAGEVTYFKLPLTVFATSCTPRLHSQFTLGGLVIPIKMRFGSSKTSANGNHERNFDFQGNVNLGLLVGYKLVPNSRSSISILTGISLTSVPIDSTTTKSFITQSTNAAAITWNILSVVYQIDNFQIGIVTGIDYLSGEVAHYWVYRNRPWLGIGLGFSIFSPKKTTDSQ